MTALGDVLGAARGRPAAELLDLDPLALEGEMRGHPWIVASKGRLGFGASDLLAYAPEAAQPLALRWLAAAPAIADRRCVDGLAHATVVREQVGEQDWALLRECAAAAGLDPDAATYLPVHPWQWEHRDARRSTRATSRAASSSRSARWRSATCRISRSARSPTSTTPIGATSSSRCRSSTRRSTAACRATARSPRRR